MVGDDSEVLELLVVHRLSLGEVADVDDVGKNHLVQRAVRVARVVHRQNRPPEDVVDVVRDHAKAAKLEVDLAEQRLILVERQETHLGVDRHRALEILAAALEHQELRALHVDLQEIERRDLGQIVENQSAWHGTHWYIIFQPLGFIIYLIAAIAETNRVPFDLPEAETELVAAFHTEYSAMKFALFFLAEYINMFTVSMLATTLFWGGWNVPFLDLLLTRGSFLFGLINALGFIVKICVFLFIYIWLRGTLPRFRFDQLMSFGWKFLLPLALLSIFVTATLVFLNVV